MTFQRRLAAFRNIEGDDLTGFPMFKAEDNMAPIRDSGQIPDILELTEWFWLAASQVEHRYGWIKRFQSLKKSQVSDLIPIEGKHANVPVYTLMITWLLSID